MGLPATLTMVKFYDRGNHLCAQLLRPGTNTFSVVRPKPHVLGPTHMVGAPLAMPTL